MTEEAIHDAGFPATLTCDRCPQEATRVMAPWMSERRRLALCDACYEAERGARADDLGIERERPGWFGLALKIVGAR
jgi:hypothetical protein